MQIRNKAIKNLMQEKKSNAKIGVVDKYIHIKQIKTI